MRIKITCILLFLLSQTLYCQNVSIPIEVFSSVDNFYYQHSFYKTIGNSKFSFFNLSSIKKSYDEESKNNSYLFRNQLFYKIHKHWNLGLTGELTNKEAKIRLGIQYLLKNKKLIVSIYSNITVSDIASFVNMLYLEYKPKISDKVKFYSRFQIQTTTYFGKNIKYSNLYRIGIEFKSIKMGIGMPWFNPFSTKNTGTKHVGLFIGATL
ncbi:hypothetical protein [uncultured Tenacibaculum sp.]|uniref:hypothetical protein n=1 Tax=uncultured Tenacibaculum sp. TaxID=174713 RepID=UPI0026112FF1|nr:hypothetical protein [uncultured Tenacibaculum sp.]